MKKSNFVILCLLLAGFICSGMPMGENFAAKALDEVWQEVARNHYRKDFDSAYRKSVYEKFRPVILKSADMPALTENLNKMLDAVGDSHLRVFGPDNGPDKSIRPVENPGAVNSPADPGFSLLTCGKELQVRHVRPGSAAAKENVCPGDVLLAVEGWQVKQTQEDVSPMVLMATSLLERGGVGSICEVQMRGRDGKIRHLRLKRSDNGGIFFQTAALPRMVLRYETRMLNEKTGYLRFNIFAPDVVRKFRKDRRYGIFKNAENMIVDLRGNPGGILLTAEWLGAWCFPVKVPMGTLIVDGVKLTPVSEPQKDCFNKHVIVLTDGASASTSEIFAAAVQDSKTGIVIGSRTAGKCLPSLFLTLPSGLRIQTVSGDARRASGKSLEKFGVTPDIWVDNGFENGQDKVLAKALSVLAEKGN